MAGTAVKVTSRGWMKGGKMTRSSMRKTHNKNVWQQEGSAQAATRRGGLDEGDTSNPFWASKNDEPLVQHGHEFFQPQLKSDSAGGGFRNQRNAPLPIEDVSRDKSGVIFSLTGGYIPTFTENFNNLKSFYRNYAGGMIVYNEAMTREGPGPMMMRGNHVWYNYAGDYLARVKEIGEAAPKDGSNEPELKDSMWDDIFDMYIKGTPQHIKPLMTTWRNELGVVLREKTEERVSKKEMKAIDRSDVQAPEEGLIQLLSKRDKKVELATTGTTGGARGLDVQLMVAGKLVQYDATQSKITSGQTHSGLGKLSLTIQAAADTNKTVKEQVQRQAEIYFKRSELHLNQMLKDLHTVAEKARGKGKTGTTRDILKELDFKTGDIWTGAHIDEQMLKQGVNNKKTRLVNAAGKEVKRAFISQAYDEAMHILGFATSLNNDVWQDQVGGRVPINPGSNLIDFIAEVSWTNIFSGAGSRLLQLVLGPIDIHYDARMMIEVVMGRDKDDEKGGLGYGKAAILRIIEDGNMLWNFHDMGLQGDSIAFGKLYADKSMGLTGAGYHIAMGGAEFVESTFNAELGKILQEVVDASIANPKQHAGRIQNAMAAGQVQAMKFSQQWKKGAFDSGSLITAGAQYPNQDQSELLRWSEMQGSTDFQSGYESRVRQGGEEAGMANATLSSDMAAQDTSGLKRIELLNRLLKNYVWVMPYIGVHYQGGKSQKIEPMMTSGAI